MDLANLLLRVTGENQDAKRSLEEVALEMRKIASEEFRAKLTVNTKDALGEVARLEAALAIFSRRDYTQHVKVKVDDAKAKLKLLKDEIEHSLAGGSGSRSIDDIFGDINGLAGKIENLAGETGQVTSNVGKMGESFVSFLSSAAPVAGIIAVIGVAIVALAGALGALIASFAAAAAGAAVLAIAFGATLLPVILLGVAALLQFKKASEASQKQQQQEAEAAQRVKTARQSLATATESVKTATQGVSRAQQSVADEAKAAWDDWRQSIQAVHDDMLQVQYAQLGISQSNLNVKKAAQDLKDALKGVVGAGPQLNDVFKKFTNIDFNPDKIAPELTSGGAKKTDALDIQQKVLDYRRALLEQKSATDSLHSSNQRLAADQQKVADYQQRGIEAYKPYTTAVESLATAERSLHHAQEIRTRDEQTLAAALTKQHTVQQQYTKDQSQFGNELKSIGREFSKVLEPLTKPILRAGVELLHDLMDTLKDPDVKSSLGDLAHEIALFLRDIGKFASSREGRRAFVDIANAATHLTAILGRRVFIDFLKLMTRLAEAALPDLLDLVDKIGRKFDDWESGTRNGKRVQGTVQSLVSSFRDWLGLIRSVARLLLSFFRGGKDDGDNLVRTITHMVNKWADFLNTEEGQKRLKEFLKSAIKFTGQVADLVGAAVLAATQLLNIFEDILNTIKDIIGFGDKLKATVKDAVPGGNSKAAGLVGKVAGDAVSGKALQDLLDAAGIHVKIPGLSPASAGKKLINILTGRAAGGWVDRPGGFGDNGLTPTEGGEFVIKRSVAQALGNPFLGAINAGIHPGAALSAVGGGSGGRAGVHIGQLILPEPPSGGTPDARASAVMMARELKRRGF